jgi:hypothetical protein
VIVDYCFALWLLQRALSGGGRKKPTDVSSVSPASLRRCTYGERTKETDGCLRACGSRRSRRALPVECSEAAFLHRPGAAPPRCGDVPPPPRRGGARKRRPPPFNPLGDVSPPPERGPPRGGACWSVPPPPSRGASPRRCSTRRYSTS